VFIGQKVYEVTTKYHAFENAEEAEEETAVLAGVVGGMAVGVAATEDEAVTEDEADGVAVTAVGVVVSV
jgi:hypothetical protein